MVDFSFIMHHILNTFYLLFYSCFHFFPQIFLKCRKWTISESKKTSYLHFLNIKNYLNSRIICCRKISRFTERQVNERIFFPQNQQKVFNLGERIVHKSLFYLYAYEALFPRILVLLKANHCVNLPKVQHHL